MSAYRRLTATGLLTACVFSAVAPQQSEPEPLETITVIGTRTERSLEEVSATVTVKTADDTGRELARDIVDLVRFERVLTTIDGLRGCEESSLAHFRLPAGLGGHRQPESGSEIARAPISSRHASDTLGGVIALTTRQPGNRTRLNAGPFYLTDEPYIRWVDTAGTGRDAPQRFTQPGFNAALALRVEFRSINCWVPGSRAERPRSDSPPYRVPPIGGGNIAAQSAPSRSRMRRAVRMCTPPRGTRSGRRRRNNGGPSRPGGRYPGLAETAAGLRQSGC